MPETLFGNIETSSGLQCVRNQPARVPHNGTETSKAAAKRQTVGKVDRDLATIREAFALRGAEGFTRDELAEATEIKPNSLRPRVATLVSEGTLVPKRDADGDLVKRPTATGSPAQVLVHTRHATNQEIARP